MKDAEIFGKDTNETYRPVRVSTDGNPLVSGDVAHDVADSGRPVKIGGVARQTNPTAVSDGDRVQAVFDDLGRQMTRYTMRDTIVTAYLEVSTGTKTALQAGIASTFLDLKQMTLANNSSVAVTVEVLDESTTVRKIVVPVTSTIVMEFDPAIPQSAQGVAWYVDLDDITGTTVLVGAEFVREV